MLNLVRSIERNKGHGASCRSNPARIPMILGRSHAENPPPIWGKPSASYALASTLGSLKWLAWVATAKPSEGNVTRHASFVLRHKRRDEVLGIVGVRGIPG